MSQTTLVLGATFAIITALVYTAIGRILARRDVSEDSNLAIKAFSMWWYALAGTTALGGVQTLVAAFGELSLPMATTFQTINIMAICIALAGLLYYLIYLYTGRRGAWVPVAWGYGIYFVFLLYFIQSAGPIGVQVGDWSVGLAYDQAPETLPTFMPILVLLIFPIVIAAIAYFSLVFRVKERGSRFRVSTTSLALVVWFMSAFLASQIGLSDLYWWPVASRTIALLAAVTILFAHVPPAWFKRKTGVEGVLDDRTTG